MARSTSICLGDHFEDFIARQIQGGRYGSVSEVIRTGLRLLEEHEHKLGALRRAAPASSTIAAQSGGNNS